MVVDLEREAETDLVLHALADTTRRDIVRRTLVAEHSVSDLARLYPMSFAAVQKHVAVLQRARLVAKRQRGREQLVSARIDSIRKATRMLDELETLWRGRVDRMADVLRNDAVDDIDAVDAVVESASHPASPTARTKPAKTSPTRRRGAPT